MFHFRRSSNVHSQVNWQLAGLHCTGCAMNIDGALEDTPGVISATTNYAQSRVKIVFDEHQVSEQQLRAIITTTGYQVVPD